MIRRVLLLALTSVACLLAADPTGTWQGELPGQGGQTYPMTFKLKAEGAKLSGTMGSEQFEQAIANGEINGDDIKFTVHLDFNDGIDLKFVGKVGADKIDFTVERNGGDKPAPFVAKKT